jgi:hypothetical protein
MVFPALLNRHNHGRVDCGLVRTYFVAKLTTLELCACCKGPLEELGAQPGRTVLNRKAVIMARLRHVLLSLAWLSARLVGAQVDDEYKQQDPLYGGFDIDACPDYAQHATYPQ